MKTFDFYKLAIKYWLQGDSWLNAKIYARTIVRGFRKPK